MTQNPNRGPIRRLTLADVLSEKAISGIGVNRRITSSEERAAVEGLFASAGASINETELVNNLTSGDVLDIIDFVKMPVGRKNRDTLRKACISAIQAARSRIK